MSADRSLNHRRRLFVAAYLKSLDATEAAIEAGYSRKRAHVTGHELRKNLLVAAAIQKSMNERAEKLEIAADRVLEEIAAVAFAHMGQYATWRDDSVSLRDSSEVDPRAVSEVRQTASRNGVSVSIKLHDKLAALEKLGRHLGMWKDAGQDAGSSPVKAYPDSEWERLP